jgi:hypothetical protein
VISESAASFASVGVAWLSAVGGAGLLLGLAPRVEPVKPMVLTRELRLVACHCDRYRCSGVRRVWVHRFVPIDLGEDECAHD